MATAELELAEAILRGAGVRRLVLASHHDKRAGGQHDVDGLPSKARTAEVGNRCRQLIDNGGSSGGSAPLQLLPTLHIRSREPAPGLT